ISFSLFLAAFFIPSPFRRRRPPGRDDPNHLFSVFIPIGVCHQRHHDPVDQAKALPTLNTRGSSKTALAVSKLILCFVRLRRFFASSHSKRIKPALPFRNYIIVHTDKKIMDPLCRPVRPGKASECSLCGCESCPWR